MGANRDVRIITTNEHRKKHATEAMPPTRLRTHNTEGRNASAVCNTLVQRVKTHSAIHYNRVTKIAVTTATTTPPAFFRNAHSLLGAEAPFSSRFLQRRPTYCAVPSGYTFEQHEKKPRLPKDPLQVTVVLEYPPTALPQAVR